MADKNTQRDHERLLDNLKILQRQHTIKVLCTVLGVSRQTWKNRMSEPWRHFSYDDFRALAKYCKVDFITLVDGTLSIK